MIEWLFSRQRIGIKPDLARIKKALSKINNPQNNFKSIIVGGTNGKGSTSASLASILKNDKKTGLFTSPHLLDIRERFLINGEMLLQKDFLQILTELKPVIEEFELTFFEAVFLLACEIFSRNSVYWAVMEVGLGGRLDATNVLEPEMSIVTNIELDHVEFLGDSLEKIAIQKAGILRKNKPAIIGTDLYGDIFSQFSDKIFVLNQDFTFKIIDMQKFETSFLDEQSFTTLKGIHGISNAVLAGFAAKKLLISEQNIQKGLSETIWQGRLEEVIYKIDGMQKNFLLDAAHNPKGMQSLINYLVQCFPKIKFTFVVGFSIDKNILEMLEILKPHTRQIIFTQAVFSPRSISSEKLAEMWQEDNFLITKNIQEAVNLAPNNSIICGSLYLLGEFKSLESNSPNYLRMQ